MWNRKIWGGLGLCICLLWGCGTESSSDVSDGGADTTVSDAAGEAGCPETMVTLTFAVDDRANQTYGNGELLWTGSFVYDGTNHTLTYATSWLPEEGPYVPLYDDGPRSAGGHEAEGQEAGDHILSAAVCYLADEDRLFAYGVLNDDLRWVWVGLNGQFEVPQKITGTIDVEGLTFEAFGSLDLIVTLDMNALHADYEGISLETDKVFIKGTMNSWTPVQLLDDGKGEDAIAGDGVVTYHHGASLGTHDGLLNPGQEAQFVFVFAKEGVDPDSGQEYKVAGDAVNDGVGALGTCEGIWEPLTPTSALDSKGKVKNSSVTLCDEGANPACSEDAPCPEGQACVDDVCVGTGDEPELLLVVPAAGSSAGGTQVTLIGEGLEATTEVRFGELDAEIILVVADKVTVLTPAQALGMVDVTLVTPGGQAVYLGGYTYIEGGTVPSVAFVNPSSGSTDGGTSVTLTGANFQQGATVVFGNSALVDVQVSEAGATLTGTTAAHPVGATLVRLTNPDGQVAELVDGFTFVGALPGWGMIQGPLLNSGEEGDVLTYTAEVYHEGTTEGPGAGFNMSAEIGYGSEGTDPASEPGWNWSTASYTGESGNNDVYSADISPPKGVWAVAFRFSINGGESWLYVDLNGTDDGFQVEHVAAAEVTGGGSVNMIAITPQVVSPMGGTAVTLDGTGFTPTCTVMIGEKAVVASYDDQTFTFIAPAHAPGSVQVAVLCDEGQDSMELTYEGTWDGILDEWANEMLLGESNTESDWGELNVLNGVWAWAGGDWLYLAVDGAAMGGEFGPNAIVGYIDLDAEAGTGLVQTQDVENQGALDSAVGGVVTFDTVADFGAEVVFGTLNGASYAGEADGMGSDMAGWRRLTPPADLPWLLNGFVMTSGTGVEAGIDLAELLGPPTGENRQIAVIIHLVNQDGSAMSNQRLPQSLAQAYTLSFVY